MGEEGVSKVYFGPVTSGISENSKGAISVVAFAAGRRPPDVFQNDPPPLAKRDVRTSSALAFQRAPLQPLPIEPLEAAIFSRREGKSGITTLLRSLTPTTGRPKTGEHFGQRRALATRDRKFSRPDAEAHAFNRCVAGVAKPPPHSFICGTGVVGAAGWSATTTCCCRLASTPQVTPGCTAMLGIRGATGAKGKPSRR